MRLTPPARDRGLLPDEGLLDATFDDLDVSRTAGLGKAIRGVETWIDEAVEVEPNGEGGPSSGLVVSGPTGVGKTHLMTAAATKLSSKLGPEYVSSGYRVLLIGEPQLRTYVRRCWKNGDDWTRLRRAIEGRNRSWLFLDDLGAVAATDASFADELADLLMLRHASRFRNLTVISTNVELPVIERFLGPRVASRLYESLRAYRLEGEDQRTPAT